MEASAKALVIKMFWKRSIKVCDSKGYKKLVRLILDSEPIPHGVTSYPKHLAYLSLGRHKPTLGLLLHHAMGALACGKALASPINNGTTQDPTFQAMPQSLYMIHASNTINNETTPARGRHITPTLASNTHPSSTSSARKVSWPSPLQWPLSYWEVTSLHFGDMSDSFLCFSLCSLGQ